MAKRKTSGSTNGKSLVIVESPAKAKTINKYLGSDYVVKASMGHVRDLPSGEFGIDVSNGFAPTYEIVARRRKAIAELKKLASAAPRVFLATDLDREGEAIAWHLVQALGLSEDRISRVIFNEITATAISEAFANPHEIDIDRVNAQQARRILDRIVGYELSPLLWKKIARGLSAGRVQSVTVRLVVDREREIRAFIPKESWKVVGYLSGDPQRGVELRPAWSEFIAASPTQKGIGRWLSEQGCFRTELVELGGKDFKAADADSARVAVEALGYEVENISHAAWSEYKHLELEKAEIVGRLGAAGGAVLTVSNLTVKKTITKPSAPFRTSTLQQQASTVMRFAASRTMRTAQSLYEGIDLNGEGPVGLITYMRTDSTHLSKDSVNAVRELIRSEHGPAYVPDKPQMYGKKVARAQEAHEAIRPTDPRRTPESIRKALSNEQFRLYDLIWRRFVACQMPPARWDSTSVSVTCETPAGQARFAGNGRKLTFDGFMKVTGITSEDQILPDLAEGKRVGLVDLVPNQHFTSPPARYTEASLVKALEAEGIGRPSTYAAIIETIQKRGYVEQEQRKFFASALGEVVTDKLVEHFPKIMDLKFTSFMEDELDKIEESQRDWVHVLHEFYDPFKELLNRAGDEMPTVRNEPSDVVCSECEKPMVYRWSKTGRFLACSGYPKCKTTVNVDRDGRPIMLEESEHVCELCNKKMIHRQSRTGHFLGCSGYPECRNTIACDASGEPLRLVTEDELKQPCDACGGGTMVVKRKGRRSFLGCDQYPKCKNTASLPEDVRLKTPPPAPVEEAGINCERCQKPMVIRSGKRGKFIACSGFPRCRNTKPIEKLDELKAAANNGKPGAASVETGATRPNGKKKYSPENNGEPPPGFAWTRTGRPVVEAMPEENTLICPECGDIMALKRGRFGPFFSCSAFPGCKFVSNLRGEAKKKAEELMPAPVRPKPEPSGVPCDECGKEMLIRQGRRGKFLGCSGYPKCTHTMELPAGVAG